MPRKPRRNIDQKGRSLYPTAQFVGLGYEMLNHENFRALSGASVKVLLLLATKHGGFNNGRLGLSYDQMASNLNMGKSTAYKACEELQYYGFIKLRKLGQFHGRLASEWEITFIRSEGYQPTHDWKQVKPRRNRRSSRSKPPSPIEEVINSPEYADSKRRKIETRYQVEFSKVSTVLN